MVVRGCGYRERIRPKLQSGETRAAGGTSTALELSTADRAVGTAIVTQGLPGAEDDVLERHLRWLEQSLRAAPLVRPPDDGRGLGRDCVHETLRKTPTT